MSFKIIRIAFLVCCAASVKAQTFDIEQSAQLIRPRMKLDSKFTQELGNNGSLPYKCLENSVGITFPITQKFKTEIDLDLKNFKLKDIFKKNIRVKADQILGTFKITQRNTNLGIDSAGVTYNKNLYYVNVGFIGLHLTKKYRIMFYSLNMSMHEEDKTFNQFTPRFSGIIGQYHIKGLRKCLYYGVSMIYSDGLFVPSPFIGGTEPINSRWSFNYTLPVQLNLQYHQNKSYTIFGVKSDGYRSGVYFSDSRINLNYGNAAVFLNFRYRISRTFQAQAECGYNFYQYMSFDNGIQDNKFWPSRTSSPLKSGFYANATLNIYFGKSLLEKVTDQLF